MRADKDLSLIYMDIDTSLLDPYTNKTNPLPLVSAFVNYLNNQQSILNMCKLYDLRIDNYSSSKSQISACVLNEFKDDLEPLIISEYIFFQHFLKEINMCLDEHMFDINELVLDGMEKRKLSIKIQNNMPRKTSQNSKVKI